MFMHVFVLGYNSASLALNSLVTLYRVFFFPVLIRSTGPPAQDQQNFLWTSKFFSSYLELYENKLKNLIRTSKFKFLFRGLLSLCT